MDLITGIECSSISTPENAEKNNTPEKVEIKSENVHPQHWCGQHKFNADSPTNVYNYCNNNHSEKSAMCRIAEIARFNKIKHIYDLQDESGPAHKKLFTVKLILTPEEIFEGSGTSIKRAQQASAILALENTKLPVPPEKPVRKKTHEPSKPHRVLQNVCRTLQYSSPNYISCNPPVYPDPGCPFPEHILLPPAAVAMYQAPFPAFPIDPVRPHGPKLQAVIVNINGKSIATGVGESYPLAKQDAASKALLALSPLLRENPKNSESGQQSWMYEKEPIPVHKQKSVISDIHEKAHLMKVNVVFEVLKEEGPPHERIYVVRCAFVSSNNIVKAEAIGKGKKKKEAQQEACTQLLKTVEHIKPENNPVALASHLCKTHKKLSIPNREPKRKTIVKDKKMDPLYGHQINPVSRLIQITQAKDKSHPTFELIAEHGLSKYKEFIVRVQYGDEIREGRGPNKRLAKRAAAEAMLETIGYVKPLPAPGKSLLKKNHEISLSQDAANDIGDFSIVENIDIGEPCENQEEINEPQEDSSPEFEKRRVTFNSQVHACPPPGDQDYPKSIVTSLKKDAIVEGKIRRFKRTKENRRVLTVEQVADISKTAQTFIDTKDFKLENQEKITAYNLLNHLSINYKFSVQYTTFPEAAPSQYFTIVSLGLEEPLIGHGTGGSVNEADENAAFAAIIKLKELSEREPEKV